MRPALAASTPSWSGGKLTLQECRIPNAECRKNPEGQGQRPKTERRTPKAVLRVERFRRSFEIRHSFGIPAFDIDIGDDGFSYVRQSESRHAVPSVAADGVYDAAVSAVVAGGV